MMRARAIGSDVGCCLGRPRPISSMATGSSPFTGYQSLSRHFIFMRSTFNNCISYKRLLFKVLCSTPNSLPRPRSHCGILLNNKIDGHSAYIQPYDWLLIKSYKLHFLFTFLFLFFTYFSFFFFFLFFTFSFSFFLVFFHINLIIS